MEQVLEKETLSDKLAEKEPRNYELDFLKLFFSIMVFLCHTAVFIGEDTRFKLLPQMGSVSVHFFFLVSGMLMANSILKQNVNNNFGKASIDFVLHKFKSVAWVLWASGAIVVGILLFKYIYIYIYSGQGDISGVVRILVKAIPEIFQVTMAGIDIRYNDTWYISAMLLAMLPLSYLMYKNRSFSLYVFAPLTALLTFGYMCKKNNFVIMSADIFGVGIFRAICGLCFGICAYLICDRLKRLNQSKRLRVFLTVAEVALYLIFFLIWFTSWNDSAVMSVVILLPIAVAITFSGKSYIANLFRFKWMKCFAPLSLYIYLNHDGGPKNIVRTFFPNRSWKESTALLALFSLASCVLCWLIVKFGKKLWSKKIKPFFIKPDKS